MIVSVIEKGDAFEKSGDDFPARLYVTFEYDPAKLSGWEKLKYRAARLLYGESPPLHALTYVWANSAKPESIIPNAHSARAVMIVVQSGEARLGQWVDETRDVYKDYKEVFGENPPMLSGVAMMTDSDNTGESAVAYYGDIVFAARGPL